MIDVYENYGDANFFEGGCFIKDCGDATYDVITCNFINDAESDACYLVEDGAVDISDSWIDVDAVLASCGDGSSEGATFARDVVDYYGLEQCGSTRSYIMTAEEVIEFMDDYAKQFEFDSNTWSSGPLD